MILLFNLCAAVVVAAWIVAVVAGVRLFPLRQDRISGWTLACNGIVWFRADTFKPAAAGLHRTFLRAIAMFVIALFLLIVIVALNLI